jgi:hypothetical protein
MYAPEHIQLFEELRKEAEAKVAAIDPQHLKMLLTGLGGVAAGAVPTAMISNYLANQELERAKTRAFATGVAAGVIGPRVLDATMQRIATPPSRYY